MIPSFRQVAVIDTFLGRCMSLHPTAQEADLATPRDAIPGAFVLADVIVTVEIARPLPPGFDIQPPLF